MAEVKILSTGKNRHPVDELADIRDEMRKLKVREEIIRCMLIDGACSQNGDTHVATVRTAVIERIDTEALKKELGMQVLRPYVRKAEMTTVRTKAR